MNYSYKTIGTCSQEINLETDGDIVQSVSFVGGCNGNLKGLAKIIEGMKVDEVIQKLEGIKCGMKRTSCPDQLAQALKKAKERV